MRKNNRKKGLEVEGEKIGRNRRNIDHNIGPFCSHGNERLRDCLLMLRKVAEQRRMQESLSGESIDIYEIDGEST
jgi:hypothetical protein